LTHPKPLILIILDGWGYRAETKANAIALARKPVYDRLLREYPNTLIQTSGPYVGLPDGQMGNSEVGHLNIGAGRIDRAQRTNRISCLISFTALTVMGAILFFTGRTLSALLMPQAGEEAISHSATFIHVIAFSFGFIGLQQVLSGTLRGAGDTVAPMVLAILSLFVVRFPLAWVLSNRTSLHADGIWWAVAISIVISAILTGLYFLRGDWKTRRLLEETSLEDSAERQMAMEEGLPF